MSSNPSTASKKGRCTQGLFRNMTRAQKEIEGEKMRKIKTSQRTCHHLARHERSISTFKRVKTEMRKLWKKKSLTEFDVAMFPNDFAMKIDYNDAINDFEMIKAVDK
ncbi:hypothetical protein TNCV_3142091 [Trichonephila clavipes]|nr:hypothetical protein TNCV_3142091 [Trichonephila clavipes]